jgi:hypothetical protein
MSKKILKLWGKGQFKISDFKTTAYVLEDGTALLDKTRMFEAIGMKRRGSSRSDSPAFIGAINLQKFIRPELEEQLKGVQFYDGATLKSCYPAEILASVCNVYLEAREAKELTPTQQPIAQACEILLRSFAKVGIRALIYEQLGFEKFKHPEAFRILIESYLSDEIRKWAKEFPDELFYQMDRIYGNQPTTSRNRPQYYANFLRKYIYSPIEKGIVLKRLDEINPKDKEKGYRKHRHHSATSEEIGLPAIKSQIWQVVGILKASGSKRVFENNYAKLMGQSYQGDLFDTEE